MLNLLLFTFLVVLLTFCLHNAHYLFNKQQTPDRNFTTMFKGVTIFTNISRT